ncbi:MAG: hypothetical protein IKS48_08740 [Eubacterium sp.]|nr:hypothetical protein [Eubacterium sp.]
MIELNEKVTREMNKYLDETTIEEILARNKKMFHFQIMFNKQQMNQEIDVLDLSMRGYNCLKRHGFKTLRDLVNGVETKDDATSKKQLLRLRNLGRNTAEEILMKLFYYQFQILSDEGKRNYMQQIVELNL